ncbi:ABC transporter ATP-binding protein [Jeotgalibaca sp. MA1X17-3]|uniref:ABC transporter ATP-binding protein n=1 Tax=Jeotgalibaca sp. MA1X17-3 TaxID=2908211 RepID=UPI001F22D133|nr:ABC transporter ATP-binding protein [Jeotgalibaca sp. MA1X17-3]UJF15381.1 ABC transporter ATP-binding protein [Jeotgalibaca sp. MA1X17-3]
MIELKNISKTYGMKQALKNINVTIKPGEIFGLIGHNGAGKSTAIKSLVSIIEPSEGEIWVDGEQLSENRLNIKKRIGYVSDSPDMFLRLTAAEYWNLIAVAYDVSEEEKTKQLKKFMELFDMTEHQSEVISSFSHGMRQKTFIIGALLPNPDIWILDEPMTGLDPQASFDLKELMKQHAAEGNIVLFSTHALEIAQQLCNHIAILKKGEILYDGTTQDLIAQNENESLETIYLKLAGRQSKVEENESSALFERGE